MKNNKSNKKEKRTLILGLCLSAVFVAGTTFAWFTSTDEVTNRLSAKGEYDVAITEDFTPPSDWVPGQEINKDVKAINTGNTDAWVKFQLAHQFTVTKYGESIGTNAVDKSKAIILTDKAAIAEQAGGYAVVQAGSVDADPINAGTLLPGDDGLYIFRATIAQNADSTGKVTSTYSYSGYYKVSDGTTATYYAIDIPDGFAPETSQLANVKIKTKGAPVTAAVTGASFVKLNSTTNKYDDVANFAEATALKVVYGQETSDTADDITVYVNFSETAKANYTEKDGVYYYKKAVPAGKEAEDYLIDSVTLGAETQAGAYLDLDYDLNIKLDSIQVSMNEDGTYTNETAVTWMDATTVTSPTETAVGTAQWQGNVVATN